MKTEVEIDGALNISQKIVNMLREFDDDMVLPALTGSVEHVRAKSSSKSPVDTGNLRDSAYLVSKKETTQVPNFSAERSVKEATKVTLEHEIVLLQMQMKANRQKFPTVFTGSSTFYADSVHEGTGGNEGKGPRQFLLKAVSSEKHRVMQEFSFRLADQVGFG